MVERLHFNGEVSVIGIDPTQNDVLHIEVVICSRRRPIQEDLLACYDPAPSRAFSGRREVLVDEDPGGGVGRRRRSDVDEQIGARYLRLLHVRLEGEEADMRFVDAERRGRCEKQKVERMVST